jgi:hypothetical protein
MWRVEDTMMRLGWVLLLTACSGEVSEELTACAGDHEGSFAGDDSGAIVGVLEKNGTLAITFEAVGLNLGADAEVDAEGNVTGCKSAVCVDGTYTFDSCSATGSWTSDIGAGGTWEIEGI